MSTKIIILDDDDSYLIILKLLLEEKGYNNICTFNNIVQLMEELDDDITSIIIIDYHLNPSINGGQSTNMIRDVTPDAEFIIISGLLHPDEYETLINTSGCNAISRKDDVEKISFLINRAESAIQRRYQRLMEIAKKGKEIIDQIEKF